MSHKPFHRILLTGVTGFIGHHLATHLIKEGHEVHAILRPESDRSRLPVRTVAADYDGTMNSMKAILETAKPDLVIHLASCFLARHTVDDIDRLVDSNLRFGLHLLEAMSLSGCHKLINTGTAWQHYQNANYDPVCLYAATKQAFEDLTTYYVNAHQFQTITLKLHDTYGPGDTRRKIISLLMDAAFNQTELELSPGEQLIDITHIDDVVEAFDLTMNIILRQTHAGSTCYMVSSGRPQSLKSIAAIIENKTALPINARWGARDYREREVMVPWNKGLTPPNWEPKVNLEKWIEEQK